MVGLYPWRFTVMRRSRQRSKALLALKRLFLASNQLWQAQIHPSYSNSISKLVTQPFWILLPFQLYMAHRILWFYLLKHGTEFFTSTNDCSYFSNLRLQTSVLFSVLLNVFQGQNLSVASQINCTNFTLAHWHFQRNKEKKIPLLLCKHALPAIYGTKAMTKGPMIITRSSPGNGYGLFRRIPMSTTFGWQKTWF